MAESLEALESALDDLTNEAFSMGRDSKGTFVGKSDFTKATEQRIRGLFKQQQHKLYALNKALFELRAKVQGYE